MTGKQAFAKIDAVRDTLEEIALNMWREPEGPFREHKAAKWVADALEAEGFTVEMGAGGVPTAIKATWGSGRPVYGILGELDALPGMSQIVATHKEAAQQDGYGQACGHNLLGVGSLGGAIGLKAEMEARGLPGTVVYYGCPAEEILVGKGYMARGGAFDDIDYSVAYHPGTVTGVNVARNTALNSAYFHFKGITAHAGGDPHNGRSALDAVEIMNVGANYLREHVTSDVRIHYIITEGGVAPNIVPDRATSKYFVRAFTRQAVEEVYERVLDLAKGAAIMTGTTVEVEYLGGCYQNLPNMKLAEVLDSALREIPREGYTEEEREFARALNASAPKAYSTILKRTGLPEGTEFHEDVLPLSAAADSFGSTDVGDVQHIAPGIMFTTASYNLGAPGHSWQIAACSGHSIGMKGMLYAAKAIALLGLKVIEDPQILIDARAEFDAAMAGQKYVCPITDDMPIPQ